MFPGTLWLDFEVCCGRGWEKNEIGVVTAGLWISIWDFFPPFNVIFIQETERPVFHLQWLWWCFCIPFNEGKSSSYLATLIESSSALFGLLYKTSFFKGIEWCRWRRRCLLPLEFPEYLVTSRERWLFLKDLSVTHFLPGPHLTLGRSA